ncbi:MAG: hypothetical protein KAW88_06905 [Candidatus Cloacimonetes bacterium]|nr:hypothetical protein [Candidatus Cloacimonadota bacterium]
MKNLPERRSNFLLYSSSDGDIRIDVRLEDETVWLTQKLIAELLNYSTKYYYSSEKYL